MQLLLLLILMGDLLMEAAAANGGTAWWFAGDFMEFSSAPFFGGPFMRSRLKHIEEDTLALSAPVGIDALDARRRLVAGERGRDFFDELDKAALALSGEEFCDVVVDVVSWEIGDRRRESSWMCRRDPVWDKRPIADGLGFCRSSLAAASLQISAKRSNAVSHWKHGVGIICLTTHTAS